MSVAPSSDLRANHRSEKVVLCYKNMQSHSCIGRALWDLVAVTRCTSVFPLDFADHDKPSSVLVALSVPIVLSW